MNFYTLHGTKLADKSVGLFQIKPSFVEKLEQDLSRYAELQRFSFIWDYPNKLSEKQKRVIRSKRMLDLNWQIDYLLGFVNLLELIHSNTNESFINTTSKKIAFFSSAYNSGYWYDETKITYYKSKKFFPHGIGNKENKYAYSDISVYYYQNFIKN